MSILPTMIHCRLFCIPTFAETTNIKMMYYKKLISISIAGLLTIAAPDAEAQTSTSIGGKWKDVAHPEKQVEFTFQQGKYLGKSISNAQSNEAGKTIFKDLVWNENTKSYKAIIINPDNGEGFKTELKMIGTDKFKFTVGKLFFSKTFTFNRIAQ